MEQALKQLKDTLSVIIDLLYQENTTPAYAQLAAVLPVLEREIAKLDADRQQQLAGKLQDALAAMESGDNTLLADILQYEIAEQLEG